MDAHLGIAKTNASEQLRVGRAMQHLPVLESVFALGQISFSQLREVTRVATARLSLRNARLWLYPPC